MFCATWRCGVCHRAISQKMSRGFIHIGQAQASKGKSVPRQLAGQLGSYVSQTGPSRLRQALQLACPGKWRKLQFPQLWALLGWKQLKLAGPKGFPQHVPFGQQESATRQSTMAAVFKDFFGGSKSSAAPAATADAGKSSIELVTDTIAI